MKEIAAIYSGFLRGVPPVLPEISVQYADYAVWERRWLNEQRLKQLRDYWRKTLGDNPPALNLPTDFPVPAQRTFDSETH